MARSWANAFDQMMFEGKKFGAAMTDMFRSLIRMITQIIMYEAIAQPIATGIMTALPGAKEPSAQHGGTVVKTGWAKIHKGETFSGVGGGKAEININYTGQERHKVNIEESTGAFNQQVLNINMRAMQTNMKYRRNMKQVR